MANVNVKGLFYSYIACKIAKTVSFRQCHVFEQRAFIFLKWRNDGTEEQILRQNATEQLCLT